MAGGIPPPNDFLPPPFFWQGETQNKDGKTYGAKEKRENKDVGENNAKHFFSLIVCSIRIYSEWLLFCGDGVWNGWQWNTDGMQTAAGKKRTKEMRKKRPWKFSH